MLIQQLSALAACAPSFFMLEIMFSDVVWRSEISDENLHYEDGHITIPDKPGLGIELNEDAFDDYPYEPRDLRHYTGALTDIRPPETKFYF